LGFACGGAEFMKADLGSGLQPLLIMTTISSVLGIHLVMAIGGADMPVVISMLNSGWWAAAGYAIERSADHHGCAGR